MCSKYCNKQYEYKVILVNTYISSIDCEPPLDACYYWISASVFVCVYAVVACVLEWID